MAAPYLQGCRLVGGTSLALQYGHRSSVDLDMFGDVPDDDQALLEVLEGFGKVQGQKTSRYIKTFVIDNIKVDFVNYSRYPWIDDAVVEDGLRLASPKDIAAMKIGAIEGRGSKKDFFDLYFLLQHYTLEEMLSFYIQKYPQYSMFRVRMSLTYFEDAEKQDDPKLFKKVDWEMVKATVAEAVRKVNWNHFIDK
jgi:predicted nucleotidyltransferase component of viral defense system